MKSILCVNKEAHRLVKLSSVVHGKTMKEYIEWLVDLESSIRERTKKSLIHSVCLDGAIRARLDVVAKSRGVTPDDLADEAIKACLDVWGKDGES